MAIARRVFVSMPADQWLTSNQNELKWGVVDAIEALEYKAEIFFDPRGKPGLAAATAWNAAEADRVARRCVGMAIIGMPRWTFVDNQQEVNLPTEFNHYEGAIGFTLGLPMLVLAHKDIPRRIVFADTHSGFVGRFPPDADGKWLDTDGFRVPFRYFSEQLSKRRDVFLGYCGTSDGVALEIKRYLEEDLHVKVLDWKTDFRPSRTILEEIEEAAARCSAGIFLFTRDDKLGGSSWASRIFKSETTHSAAPRDNVVFEAGYFINAKGKDHVLIIREFGAKMPADLGGDIYAVLNDRADIQPVKDTVRRFCEAL